MATQCGAIDRALAGGTLTAHGPRVRQGPRPLRPLVHGSRCRRSHRPLAHWQHGRGNECLHAYRGAMLDAGLAPATVNRRLSALRSIVQLGRTFGMVTWSLEIDGVKTKAYRDTAGPGLPGGTAAKRQTAKQPPPAKAARGAGPPPTANHTGRAVGFRGWGKGSGRGGGGTAPCLQEKVA